MDPDSQGLRQYLEEQLALRRRARDRFSNQRLKELLYKFEEVEALKELVCEMYDRNHHENLPRTRELLVRELDLLVSRLVNDRRAS